MKIIGLTFCIWISTVGLIAQNNVTSISQLGRLAGCWEQRDAAKSLFISEHWMKPDGSSILGMGRTVAKGKTVDYEFMRIEQRDDGIYFVAQPKANKEETAFKLVSSTNNRLVFENKEHDFPQRVIYTTRGKRLTGRIEGERNGKFKAIDFPMVRARCGIGHNYDYN